MLQNAWNNIVKKAVEDIRKSEKRGSIPQAVFGCIVTLLVLFIVLLAWVISAHIKPIHSDLLTERVILHSLLIVLTLSAVAYTFYKRKH